MAEGNDSKDLALEPVAVKFSPGPEYAEARRKWQGVAGIERASNGRLWATWYSGGCTEDADNYVLLVTSGDNGRTWSEPVLVIDPPRRIRASDSMLWHDPLGRLWLFWMQCEAFPSGGTPFDGRGGVWFIRTGNSGVAAPDWTNPRRIAHGTMLNKPIVLSTGEWMLTCGVRAAKGRYPLSLPEEQYSSVLVTLDQGETFERRGCADVPNRDWDEHMVVERRDGSLWMLVRRKDGIGEAVSRDRGRTWQATPHAVLPGPCARFHIRRLRSGRLLLVNHHQFTGRNRLTAFLSEDDGASWPYTLLLDERSDVSYPDAVETPEGPVLVIYDRRRLGEGEILLQSLTEEDILLNRSPGHDGGRLRLVSKIHRVNLGSKEAGFEDGPFADCLIHVRRQRHEGQIADRRVSIRAEGADGVLTVPPIRFDGGSLYLNYAVLGGGSIRVELQDWRGVPIPGYALQDCTALKDDKRAERVCWKQGHDVSALAGQLIRMQFALSRADLFGFRFSAPLPPGA